LVTLSVLYFVMLNVVMSSVFMNGVTIFIECQYAECRHSA
jgi:hypothetical protein